MAIPARTAHFEGWGRTMSTYRLSTGRSTAANLLNLIGTALALILAMHIVFVLLHGNTANAFVAWVGRTSDVIALWFVNLVSTGDATFSAVLNYGLAAV